MAEVARLIAKLEADVRDFDRDMTKATKRLDKFEKQTKQSNRAMKQADRGIQGMAGSLKKMAAAAGVAFAAKKVLDFGREAVKAASDLEESVNAVEVTFGAASAGILKLGEDAATSVGLANSEFNSLAVGFSAFVDKIDAGGGNVVGIMDDLTTRVADFASVMNLDVAEAGNIFRSALAGETEAIRRFGVDVSAAAVNTKALALGLADSSAELSEQDKILARYQLVMEQTQKTAGDFANTQDSLANKQRVFAAELENAKAQIGEALLPVMTELLQLARDMLPAFEEWATGIAELIGQLTPLIGLIPKVAGLFSKFDPVMKVFKGLGDVVAAVSRVFDENKRNAKLVTDAINKIGDEADGTSRQVKAFSDGIRTVAEEGELTVEAIEDMVSATEFYKDQLEDTLGAELDWARATGQSVDTILALERVLGGVIDSLGLTEEEVNALRDEFGLASREIANADMWILRLKDDMDGIEAPDDDVAKEFKNMKTEAELAADGIQRVRDKLKALTSPAFAAIQSMIAFKEAQQKNNEVLAEFPAASDEAIEAGLDLALAFEDLISDAAEFSRVAGVDMEIAIRELGRRAGLEAPQIQGLIDLLREAGALEVVANVLVTGVDKAIAELRRFLDLEPVGAGEGTSRFSFPSTPGGGGGGFPLERKAHGGPVAGGQPYIVGEQGPELFTPGRTGTVTPNNQLGGGLTVNQTFERVEGDNLTEDIQMGLLMLEVAQWSETNN